MIVSAGQEANEDTAPLGETDVLVGDKVGSVICEDMVSVITSIGIFHWVCAVMRKCAAWTMQELACDGLLIKKELACG